VYAAYNLLSCLFVMNLRRERPREVKVETEDGAKGLPVLSFAEVLVRGRESAEEREERVPGFFSKMAEAEFDLLDLADETRSHPKSPGLNLDAVHAKFRAAWLRGGSVRSISSTQEHVFCLRRLLEAETPSQTKAARDRVVQVLAELDRRLQEMMSKSGLAGR
jgi:hypothetical protein